MILIVLLPNFCKAHAIFYLRHVKWAFAEAWIKSDANQYAVGVAYSSRVISLIGRPSW
jgi:hypothetical protein